MRFQMTLRLRWTRSAQRSVLLGLLWLTFIVPDQILSAEKQPNVLFIAVDDLNHWVHHLGRNTHCLLYTSDAADE